jgi:two-component system cell cycle response regulator DivK
MPNRGTILYIEDNADNRKLVQRVLGADDYTVDEASSASEALKYLETRSPSLILMDISMPDMDGYTLTAKIRAMPRFVQIPILAMTANVMRGDRERSLEAGCDGYIQKPIDIDTLTQQIERYINIKRNPNG